MANVLFWVAAACALAYLPLSPRAAGPFRTVLKAGAVALLAAAAAIHAAPAWLILALALCALGDALLALETDTTFMAGIGAFAAGHLAYVALFLTDPASEWALILTKPGYFWLLIILGITAATLLTRF